MKTMFIFSTVGLALLTTGCATTVGSFSPQTHFSFPNSNVKPLGQVKVTKEFSSFLIPPTVSREEALALLQDALAQKPGADLIINYKINSTTTSFFSTLPIYHVTTMTLEGTAVSMDVGEQELQAFIDQVKYK